MFKRVIIVLLSSLLLYPSNIYAQSNTISASKKYYAVKSDNTLWTWDKSVDGEVQNLHQILDNVKSVQNGYAVGMDGTLWECETGLFNNDISDEPIKVADGVDSVAVGTTTVLFHKTDNALWGVGSNITGEMATGEETERYDEPVKIMDNVLDAANGYNHTVILKKDGSVWTAGTNDYGVLGIGEEIENSLKPEKILEGMSKVYAGETSAFAIDENGTLYRWGCNYGNGVGIDDEATSYTPVRYTDNVESVCSHWGFNLILKQDGTLWIYGDSEDSHDGYTLTDVGGVSLHNLPMKIFNNVNSISEWKNSETHSTLVLTNNGEMYEFDLIDAGEYTAKIKMTKLMNNVKLSDTQIHSKDFVDISSQLDEVQKAINSLAKANIISGTSETEFSPDKSITRAEIAALLLRITAKTDENGNGGFSDVTTDDWYCNIAGASKKYNIVVGFDDNTFRGNETISKVQLVSLVARTLRNEGHIADDELDDGKIIDVPDWAVDDVSLALREDLISEVDLVNMDDDMTRADAAVVLYKLFEKI